MCTPGQPLFSHQVYSVLMAIPLCTTKTNTLVAFDADSSASVLAPTGGLMVVEVGMHLVAFGKKTLKKQG